MTTSRRVQWCVRRWLQPVAVLWLATGLWFTARAETDAPIGTPLQVLTEPYLLGSWTHLHQVYPAAMIARGGPVRELPYATDQNLNIDYRIDDQALDLEAYLERNHVTSLLVIQDGAIVFERYRMGTDDKTLFTSWSMAKSITSTLLGLLFDDGTIASLEDKAKKYVPELARSGYGDVSLRDLLQMTSGVKFIEDYADQNSREGRAWIDGVVERRLPYNETILWFNERLHPPGTHFYYASIEPQVIGWIVKRASGKSLSTLFSERIWQALGAEHDANWLLDRPGGMEIASCCINATTRDYGRFGLMIMNRGDVAGEQLISESWVDLATRADPERPFLHPGAIPGDRGFGYQHYWWLWPKDDAFAAQGYGGQRLYVNPKTRTVIVQTAVWNQTMRGKGHAETRVAFEAIVEALVGE
ncbi:MAG: serine hydrolase [Pseudomonadota bacterium]